MIKKTNKSVKSFLPRAASTPACAITGTQGRPWSSHHLDIVLQSAQAGQPSIERLQQALQPKALEER